jgi:hypothetical protein
MKKDGNNFVQMRPGIMLSFIVGSICSVIGGAAYAQDSAATKSAGNDAPGFSAERPGYTNGTDTVPPGSYQVELGYTYANGGGTWQNRYFDGSQIRFPINTRTEWRIGIPAYVTSHGSDGATTGFADLGLSVKWRFLEATPQRPSLAIILNTNLPTGSRDIGSHYFQPSSSLQAAYALSDKLGLSGSLTYSNSRDSDARFNQFGLSANLGYAVTEKMSVFGEVYWLSKTGASSGGANFFDGGTTYMIDPKTQLDLNAGVGLSGDAKNGYFIGAGVVRRW